jgi:hypothetical protein
MFNLNRQEGIQAFIRNCLESGAISGWRHSPAPMVSGAELSQLATAAGTQIVSRKLMTAAIGSGLCARYRRLRGVELDITKRQDPRRSGLR